METAIFDTQPTADLMGGAIKRLNALGSFRLDIESDEPNFEDFKDQLKAYLANKYDADFSSDELCGATIGYVYHDDDIKEMADLIFGQSEEIFTDIIRNVRFKGNGFCPKCGGSTLSVSHEKHYWFRKEPEPGEYKCLYCNTYFNIE